MGKTLVEFKNLETHFHTGEGIVKAVNNVSFKIKRRGDSLCSWRIWMRKICYCHVSYEINTKSSRKNSWRRNSFFEGKDVLKFTEQELMDMRGNDISVIFQEPMTSLNPVFKIGDQICEAIILHQHLSKEEAEKKAIEVLKIIGIARAEEIMKSYPHELSGGMRQRIMIAMAVCCNPKLLIADEPTTALDVTIQAQILDLMRDIKEKLNTSILLITHDLGVVAEMADYVVVMYAGKVIEEAPVLELFKNPLHPYTQGLLKSKPSVNGNETRLYSIPGQVPNPVGMPDNCYFNERCDRCMEKCKDVQPTLVDVGNRHKVSCWLYKEGK